MDNADRTRELEEQVLRLTAEAKASAQRIQRLEMERDDFEKKYEEALEKFKKSQKDLDELEKSMQDL
ncbi:hypothetical protein B7P34_25600 [Streptosporangium nondiastaticum]|uniref:Uncharacterized protein n=1 Tax=Streptosporangium nondiastaticum TaxID=35764 RepID=A0A9X7PFH2_9ACTN|nr:hypothetical protein [Streptosporangium nondiastaticum]PSJ25927.1 hypothetical protein B7P34_25600 [Streptosporangium nondiastaticum]